MGLRRIYFGKHGGKTLAELLFRQPDYVDWLIRQGDATGQMRSARDELNRLIDVFDRKPLLERCVGCQDPATNASVYRGSVSMFYWCETCDPYGMGADYGKLEIVRTYRGLLYSSPYAPDRRRIIRDFGRAKGLGRALTVATLAAFFADYGVREAREEVGLWTSDAL